MEDYLNQGTELLTEHDAIFRGSLGKFTRNKRVKISVGEEAIMPDGSGNKGETNVDEATSVDMLEELDEAEATDVGTDQADDDGTDVDETDDDETDEDMDKHDVDQALVPDIFSPIKKNMDSAFVESLAGKIANDEYLMEISDKLLETLQNADDNTSFNAQQHYEAVELFWKNEHFRKVLHDEIFEYQYLMAEMSSFAIRFTEESPEQKMDRIIKDPSFKKVLGEKDRVVKMSGILGIVIGYWIKVDMLVALAKEMDASDNIAERVKWNLGRWLRLRKTGYR
ncbi:hypothetical protein PHJA_001333300 [Phtheirospermum japonicum]|uniref:Uncharacterized protein n=1 Tax=Phtheirospermum japonicum TaxID=374723 RepID=A0A830C153_9LAMI|nr:hypothetical protein PHJA_001333300 [Phtheirospermum japonicum]